MVDFTTWRSLIDGAGVIPDSVVAQYDFREEDGSLPIADQTENGNVLDTGAYSGVNRTISGQQAGDFDGTDDGVSGTLSNNLSERYVVYLVIEADQLGDRGVWGDSDTKRVSLYTFGSEWRLNQGGSTIRTASASTETAYLLTLVFDSTDKLRANGTEIISGSSGSNNLQGITIGDRANVNNFDGAIGFCEVHDGEPSSGLQTREQEIANDWGISI